MLTLQMIQLMETLWKKEGLDLRYRQSSASDDGCTRNIIYQQTYSNCQFYSTLTGWSHTAACLLETRWGSLKWWRTLTPLLIFSGTTATVLPLLPSTRTLCSTGSSLRILSECDELQSHRVPLPLKAVYCQYCSTVYQRKRESQDDRYWHVLLASHLLNSPLGLL